uniref:Peptidase_M13 domain-containing protein n=1 Tax=Steinernema glaseri TaxID=37863 RepID=A0A1I8ALA4_9BILA
MILLCDLLTAAILCYRENKTDSYVFPELLGVSAANKKWIQRFGRTNNGYADRSASGAKDPCLTASCGQSKEWFK